MKKLSALTIMLSYCLSSAHAAPLAVIQAASELQTYHLPTPYETPRTPKRLTLEDAILLALRNNPNILSSQLQRITDKYALEIAYYAYEPQYNVSGAASLVPGQPIITNIGVTSTLQSTLGTQIAGNMTLTEPGDLDTQSLTITQPLIQGFGGVNLVPLLDARDQETNAKLTFKNNIITVVVAIISDYYTLVQDYNSLRVQMQTLNSQKQLVEQYQLQVRLGKLARSELLQQQSTLATTRLSTNEQENKMEQDYQQLLSDIGISPTVKFDIDNNIRITDYTLPNPQQAITMALAGNVEYQAALLNLKMVQRQVLTAEDAAKPSLDATYTVNMTHWQTDLGNPNMALSLNVPIDNVTLRAGTVNARISVMQAKLTVQNQKNALIREVLNNLTQLRNQLETIQLAQNAVKLLLQSLNAEQLKLRYGKSTVFNVTQLQNQVLSQQIDLINQQITYLLNITSFEQLLGRTLDRWHIQIKYYGPDEKTRHNFYRY